ncbi:hypothetical protein [Arthrobacter globiformis]|uniref:hypothetical protein n=1 Tax=Arthrobacter globiformis TaxID=1665 RepID=UPI0027D86348|nr:hypothetical protein [Arthrobacter globiformis]
MGGRQNGDLLCTWCWRTHPDVLAPCIRCDDTHYLSRDGLCQGCRSRDKVDALFSAERLATRPELTGIRDALLAADGTYLYKLMKKTSSSWKVLHLLVAGNEPITHDAVDAASRPGTSLLRSFLVATGVLPERNERLVAFEAWIDRTALNIIDEADRRTFLGFARWRHLHRARQHITLTCAQAAGHRRQLSYVRNFLSTLHVQGMTMSTAGQAAVDAWLAGGPPERACVRAFVQWCRANGTNQNLTVTSPRPNPLPAVLLLPERQHHALLAKVLDPDQDLDPALRLAASLVLLYGIRNHELAALPLANIIAMAEGVWIRFGPEPLHLPATLAGYAREAVNERTVTRLGRTTEDHQWLFPGLFPNQPIDPTTLSSRLTALGVKPEKTRSTAMGQLAQQLPPAILARLTGIKASTAVRWSAAVAASYARNMPSSLEPSTPFQ